VGCYIWYSETVELGGVPTCLGSSAVTNVTGRVYQSSVLLLYNAPSLLWSFMLKG